MNRDLLLMLEDEEERLTRFTPAVARLGLSLVVWRDAHRMIAECGEFLPRARLISLDHDLVSELGHPDPGDGLDVAKWLADRPPVCPVVIHTSNVRRGDAMEGELDPAGWTYHRVPPIGDDWIEVDWYRAARQLIRPTREDRHG